MLAKRLASPATTKRTTVIVSASRLPSLMPSSIAALARSGGTSAVSVAARSETTASAVRPR